MYKVNSRVSYMESEEQEYTAGKLNKLLDSSVVFGKDTIALKNILIIRKKTIAHKIARIAGIPLMFIGTLLMGEGIAGIYSDSKERSKFLLIGIGIFAAGYLPYEINFKDLTISPRGEWTLEIYTDQP